MAAHRYWRIRGSQTQNGGAFMALATVQMRLTAGGADQCTGGAAIYSSQFDAITTTSGHAGSNAFDGNINTRWASASSSAGVYWIGYDFGTGVTKDIQEVVLTARNDASFGQGPTGFFIEWSDNGVDWTADRQHILLAAWTAGSSQTFANVALAALPAVYWRIRAWNTQDGGVYFALSEVEMRATVGGADQCTGGTVLKSSELDAITTTSGHAAVNAFDNTTTTRWANATTTPANVGCSWIGYQFAAAQSIAEVVLTARNDANFAQACTIFSLSFSHDGKNWEEYKSYGCRTWSATLAQTFSATNELNIVKGTLQVASGSPTGLKIYKGTVQVISRIIQGVMIEKGTLQVVSVEPTSVKITKGTLQVISRPAASNDNEPSVSILW